MPTPASINDLLNDIEVEYTWRQRELILYKTKIPAQDSPIQKVLLRASVPFIYSHWEGFVKIITSKYLKFVSEQYLKNSELSIPVL